MVNYLVKIPWHDLHAHSWIFSNDKSPNVEFCVYKAQFKNFKKNPQNFKNNYKNNTLIVYNIENTCKLKQEKSQYYL